MGIVVGDAGDFLIIFRVGAATHILWRTAAFGISQKLLPTVCQLFSALDKIRVAGATVSLYGSTNGQAVGGGECHSDKAFVLFYALFSGSAILHDLLDGYVEHDFFLLEDNGRAHELGVFWKGPAGIAVLDPGPGFSGVELEQYAFLVKVFIHAFVVEHGHVQVAWP